MNSAGRRRCFDLLRTFFSQEVRCTVCGRIPDPHDFATCSLGHPMCLTGEQHDTCGTCLSERVPVLNRFGGILVNYFYQDLQVLCNRCGLLVDLRIANEHLTLYCIHRSIRCISCNLVQMLDDFTRHVSRGCRTVERLVRAPEHGFYLPYVEEPCFYEFAWNNGKYFTLTKISVDDREFYTVKLQVVEIKEAEGIVTFSYVRHYSLQVIISSHDQSRLFQFSYKSKPDELHHNSFLILHRDQIAPMLLEQSLINCKIGLKIMPDPV